MKLFSPAVLVCGITVAGTITQAASSQGRVFCDSDQNGAFSGNDTPLAGVLVVVTNSSGTYSNASYTDITGSYQVALDQADYYGQYLDPTSLPADASTVFPPLGSWFISLNPGQQLVTADFLISSAACVAPPVTNVFWLSGNATIRDAKRRAEHSFSGSVQPDCQPAFGPGGKWNDTSHTLRLALKGTVTRTVNAGIALDETRYIEFQGTGTLKGFGGNKANYGPVSFFCHIADRTFVSQPDLYYLRVSDSSGNTLLLVSADPANPDNVAPVPIGTGDLRIDLGTCDHPLH